MEEKYKKFADKFEGLCDEFAMDDFNAKELLGICDKIIQNYSN